MIRITHEPSNSGCMLKTSGLHSKGHNEISVSVEDSTLIEEAEQFLRFASDYLITGTKQIRAGETMAYGYWLVKFQGSDVLETWEYNANATEFIKGANLTLEYWRAQHAMCDKHGVAFRPPRPDKLTVISKGVLEG